MNPESAAPMANDPFLNELARDTALIAVSHGQIGPTLKEHLRTLQKGRCSTVLNWRLATSLSRYTMLSIRRFRFAPSAFRGLCHVGALLPLDVFEATLSDLRERCALLEREMGASLFAASYALGLDFAAAATSGLSKEHLEVIRTHLQQLADEKYSSLI